MDSSQDTANSTTTSKKNGQAYTLVELAELFNGMGYSDVLTVIPAYKAYQSECLARSKSNLRSLKAKKKLREAEVFVRLGAEVESEETHLTDNEKKMRAAVQSSKEFDDMITAAELEISLIESGYEYLEDKFIATRKLSGLDTV